MLFNIVSDDTLTLFGRVLNDLSTDDVSTITFPNDKVKMKTGKNGNTIFAKDQQGNNAMLVLKLMRGSSDDQFMQTQIANSDADFPSTVLANGSFIKRMGDGQGNIVNDVYTLLGGVISKNPEVKENTSGDAEQGSVTYTVIFANSQRSQQ